MREIFSHGTGRIFLLVLLVSTIAMLYVPKFFGRQHLFFGWMTLPFLSGVIFMLVWLVAYLVYFFLFWPYRR